MRSLSWFAIALGLSGCVGDASIFTRSVSNEPPAWTPGTDFTGLTCTGPTPGPAPMRRLSHMEYRYTIEDLFGDAALASSVAATFVGDPQSLGFSNSASLLDVKTVLGQQYMEAAEKVAQAVVVNLTTLLPCNPTTLGEAECAKQFIRKLGRRAYRRTLTSDEETRYVAKYQEMRTAYDFKTGIETMVSTILQAPNFLYRPELDTDPAGTVRPLKGLELASRLSFLLWHSVPDEPLLLAAEEGRLSTKEDVEREAKRLLADARSARVLNFYEEWLDLDKLGEYKRDTTLFTNLPTGLPDLFRNETRAFVKSVAISGDAKLSTLYGADFTFANDALARHYGLPLPGSTSFVKVALPANRRGLWMQGGPLTGHDKATRTSIVMRGLRVRTALLCQNIPAPPNDVNLTLGPVDATATQADRLAQHRTNPTCAGCHTKMDPVGQVFENFNAVGRHRTQDEGGNAVVTSGELTSTEDSNGPLTDGLDLMTTLSASAEARRCFATQMFRYTHGRQEQLEDGCSQKQAFDRFAQAGDNIQELMMGVVLSDDFLFRTVSP
jgi:hypothetical protein